MKKWIKRLFMGIIILLAAFFGGTWLIYQYLMNSVPHPTMDQLKKRSIAASASTTAVQQNASWAQYKDIPKNLVNAFVAIEDKRYFEDRKRETDLYFMFVAHWMLKNSLPVDNALSYRVARWSMPEDDSFHNYRVQAPIISRYMTEHFTKEEILEVYLNQIYLGRDETYGVVLAAKRFFGKEIKELTLTECAALAALPQGPSTYDPTSERGANKNKERRKTVLEYMKELGMIDQKAYDQAVDENLIIVSKTNP